MTVAVPPLPEQRRIVAKLDALTHHSRAARESLEDVPKLLADYRQSVLAAAFRGELTAAWRAAHPVTESGEALLARIRVERRRRWESSELAKLTARGKRPKDDGWKAKYEEPAAVDASALPTLPVGWVWASVEALSSRVTDGTHQPPVFTTEGVPFLVIANVVSGRIEWESVSKFVSMATYMDLTESCKAEKGDVLYTAVGSYGVAVDVPDDREFTFQRHIAFIKPLHGLLNTRFLRDALNSPNCRARADEVARGVAQKTVTLGELKLFPIPLPPLAEQQEIVRILDAHFARIAAVEAAVAEMTPAVDELERSVLAKAFRGELVPQDPSDEPAATLLARIKAEREAAGGAGRRRRG